jgi:hypothetical protein
MWYNQLIVKCKIEILKLQHLHSGKMTKHQTTMVVRKNNFF